MIGEIELRNFKCFEHLDLALDSLNVFSGLNGMGKSTIIQSLLLLKQSQQQNYLPDNVCLNGEYVHLGMAQDILYENTDDECIVIRLKEHGKTFGARIKFRQDFDILKAECTGNYHEISLFREPFEYLNAERYAPQVIYPKSSIHVDSKAQLGVRGEFTVHYLAKYQDDKVEWDQEKRSLKEMVQFWLNEISPDVKVDVSQIENTDYAKLGFYYLDQTRSRIFRPTNVGFGISYVLPVVVALLKACKGSMLVVENPEAHLHPRGQRKMGELIALCASKGVQICVETHSDHILNGIRIAVKQNMVKKDRVRLFYFSRHQEKNRTVHHVESPKILEDGRLDYWPDVFFDEWEKVLDEII